MIITKVITTSNVERLKQSARKLKREACIPHHQALDIVAQKAGFQHWHQVVQANAHLAPAETALSQGYILAFEEREGADVSTYDGSLIEDHLIEILVQSQLLAMYGDTVDEEDPEQRCLKDLLTPSELKAEFEEDFPFRFFRLSEDVECSTLHQLFDIVRERSFWMPIFVWCKGEFIDTHQLPATDDSGRIVGVRL